MKKTIEVFFLTMFMVAANTTAVFAAPIVSSTGQTMGSWTHKYSPNPGPLYPLGDIPTAGNDFPVTITAVSRTSGVAPLYVFFDARNALLAADGDTDLDATYVWNFDSTGVDPDKKYDRVSGFVAGHVFNLPGTYTVRLDVFNKQRQHGSTTVTITVSDFVGKTIYVSTDGNDNNTGLDTTHTLLTPAHALSLAAPNTRILFRNGDVFNISSGLWCNGNGPVIVSGYSDPAAQSSVAPEIHATFVDAEWFVLAATVNDWRFVGLKITSTGHSGLWGGGLPRYPGGIAFGGTENSLFSRIEISNVGGGAFSTMGVNSAIYECEMHQFSRAGIYSNDSDTLDVTLNHGESFIGNYIHDMQSDYEEHGFRSQGGTGLFLGFNVFEVDGAKSGIQIRGFTDHVVLYGNVVDRESGFHPQNTTASPTEIIHHCVVEANAFMGRVDPVTGEILPAYSNTFSVNGGAIGVGAFHIVIRNNVTYNYGTAVVIENDMPNIPVSDDVKIVNNTLVNTCPGSRFARFDPDTANVMVLNNLQYSTASSGVQYDLFLDFWYPAPFIIASSDYNRMFGASWDSSWHFFHYYPNMSLAQWQSDYSQDQHSMYSDPGITVMNPVAAGFAAPASGSSGVNNGTMTGAWLDFYGRMRDNSPDIGAIEYVSGDATPPARPKGFRFQ